MYEYLQENDTLKEGDEGFAANKWWPISELRVFTKYRRVLAKPDAGEEYRLLDDDETLMDGDEYHWIDTWLKYRGIKSTPMELNTFFRRKIVKNIKLDHGQGYRILAVGETIKEGDQCFNHINKAWNNTTSSGEIVKNGSIHTYRRPTGEYIVLNPGEKTQPGDQYFNPLRNEWRDSGIRGMVVDEKIKYRRPSICSKIDMEEKYNLKRETRYVLLNEGDTIEDGDEMFTNSTVGWVKTITTSISGDKVKKNIVIRRKI